jgi:hypothetical protein
MIADVIRGWSTDLPMMAAYDDDWLIYFVGVGMYFYFIIVGSIVHSC